MNPLGCPLLANTLSIDNVSALHAIVIELREVMCVPDKALYKFSSLLAAF